MGNSTIQNLNETDFKEKIRQGVVVCGFWAPWCHTCHAVMPMLDKVGEEFTGKADFIKINVVENPGISSRYGVMSLPNILVFKDGKVANQIIGSTTEKAISEKVKKSL